MPTEKVRTAMAVYIPHCVTPALLTGVRSTHKAWVILCDRSKKLIISETCSPLRSWLRVQLLTYYVDELDLRLYHLPEPPQIEALAKVRVSLLKKVIPALAPTLMVAVPDPVSSSLSYNLTLPQYPSKKLQASLQGMH